MTSPSLSQAISYSRGQRPGWIYATTIDGVSIGFPASTRPHIKKNHVDGPLLVYSDGQMHWLTFWERCQIALGRTGAETLQLKHRPKLAEVIARVRAWSAP